LDGLKQADNTYQITTRALGGVQAVGAAATTVAGTTLTATGAASCAPSAGAGCLVAAGGVALTLYGIDQTKAGVTTLMDGTPSRTIGGAFVSQWLGISPEAAELVYGVAGLSPAVAEAYAINKLVNGQVAANAWARGAYTGTSVSSYEGGVYRYSLPEHVEGAIGDRPRFPIYHSPTVI